MENTLKISGPSGKCCRAGIRGENNKKIKSRIRPDIGLAGKYSKKTKQLLFDL